MNFKFYFEVELSNLNQIKFMFYDNISKDINQFKPDIVFNHQGNSDLNNN